MSGTGAGSLQDYVQEKGKDFIDGLDDKALAEIASYNVGGRAGGAISTDLLVEAAARAAMDKATDALANDPRLVGMLSASRKQLFNAAFRNGSTKPYM